MTWEHEIKRLAIQKLNDLTSGVCRCTVSLKGVKVKLSPQVCVKVIVLDVFRS